MIEQRSNQSEGNEINQNQLLDRRQRSRQKQYQQEVQNQQLNNGRWNQRQHQIFLKGYQLYNKNWKLIADLVKTRNGSQVRSHAQKYFYKLQKQKSKNIPLAILETGRQLRKRNIQKDSQRINDDQHSNLQERSHPRQQDNPKKRPAMKQLETNDHHNRFNKQRNQNQLRPPTITIDKSDKQRHKLNIDPISKRKKQQTIPQQQNNKLSGMTTLQDILRQIPGCPAILFQNAGMNQSKNQQNGTKKKKDPQEIDSDQQLYQFPKIRNQHMQLKISENSAFTKLKKQ